jgi:hypothetical protein
VAGEAFRKKVADRTKAGAKVTGRVVAEKGVAGAKVTGRVVAEKGVAGAKATGRGVGEVVDRVEKTVTQEDAFVAFNAMLAEVTFVLGEQHARISDLEARLDALAPEVENRRAADE